MVGVRRRRWLLCGIGVWLVITATIFVVFQSVSDPVVGLQTATVVEMGMAVVGECRPLANETLPMISTSNSTNVKVPWPETRDAMKQCAGLSYGLWKDLPRASVIITFHDTETIYSLLHTIHSVIQRTPCILLQEIIVIDDFSKKEDLGHILNIYMRTIFSKQVKLFRNSENIGLIRSRLKGARLSQGDVIVFMDSHSEVQPGWLEPLLYEIKKDRKTLAHSFIDWMEKPSDDVWQYKMGGANWIVYFDWRLVFGWQTLPKQDEAKRNATDPIRIKAIIGAYAAIDRGFFGEIGELDEGMEFWGGENIDLSIRVWLFGGQVVCVPCSRVAHLEGAHSRDYRDKFTSIIRRNYKRLVEVWFDEYKTYFYLYYPDLIPVDAGNLEERLKVKARAMYNFSWFLQNVYPELGIPDRDSFAWGRLKNLQKMLCLNHEAFIALQHCNPDSHSQIFYWSQKFELRQPVAIFNPLARVESGVQRKVLAHFQYIPFYNNDFGSKWIHWKNGPMIEVESGLCLSAASGQKTMEMVACDYENDPDQVWEFEHYTDQYFDTIRGNRSIENQYKKLLSKLLSLKSKPIAALSEQMPGNKSASSPDSTS